MSPCDALTLGTSNGQPICGCSLGERLARSKYSKTTGRHPLRLLKISEKLVKIL